jgi:hypothetical protein
MDFKEKKLYHQIHPVKLAVDIGAAIGAFCLLWVHKTLLAVVVALLPPIVVSAVMITWPPDLERLKRSALGRYVSTCMTPAIELTRLLSLVPLAYGAWTHEIRYVLFGLLVLVVAWCNGLIWPRSGLA